MRLRTLKSLWTYLEKERHVDVEKVWKSLMDLVVKTIICGESPINEMCQLYLGNRYNSYELFGIDVLFDEYLKPWILEVVIKYNTSVFSFEINFYTIMIG